MSRLRLCLCPLCSRRQEAEKEICARCSEDHLALVQLYNTIIRRYPALKRRTIAQLFSAMWEKHESHRKSDEAARRH